MVFRLFAALGFGSGAPAWRAGAADPVLNLSADGEILAANPGAQVLIGAEGGLKGRSLFDFVPREDRGPVKEALARTLMGSSRTAAERTAVRLIRPGAAAVFVELAMQPQGRRIGVLLRERALELEAVRNGRAASAATGPDASGISPERIADLGHELKTPLNAMMGFAEAMETEAFGPLGNEKYQEYAGLIRSSGAHLSALIAALLDQAKLDAGRYKLAPELAPPGPIARSCAEMIRGEAEKAGLALRVDIAPDLPEALLDQRAVKQILLNLLSNAVKFTADGEIGVRLSARDNLLTFEVSDTGVGMSQMALARLGERFTGLHKSGVRGTSGAGIGLSLSFSLAKLHGGALSLTSAPGEGTVATLTLPVCNSLSEMAAVGLVVNADIQSQLDRVTQFRRERAGKTAA
ncbi:MAG: PAS domain-containing sensor histidine kinase [Pseudomonadota bacterium]